jgi:murein L,D-transpeptidase YafK
VYPPSRLVLLGLKSEKVLELWAMGPDTITNTKPIFIKSYPILGASGKLGPKIREGDMQVPEGLYRIESLNPNSRFHLSLRVNYPNAFDRQMGEQDGRSNLGSDIMIHGKSVSIGCLAMGDEAAEELFVIAADVGVEHISVILAPIDFRVAQLDETQAELPDWTKLLYATIQQEIGKLGGLKRN